MVANTRKMYEVQQILYSILNEEMYLCDTFNSLIEGGRLGQEELAGFRKAAKRPMLHADEIRIVDKEEVMNNPYLKNIQFPNVQVNNMLLSKKRIIKPGYLNRDKEEYRDLKTMKQFNIYYYCDRGLRFPGIVEADSSTCWMTVEPFEINTFKDFINDATGDVLLFGCGLGYVAYMVSLKDDVTSITIVDNNDDVIELFSTYLLPQFENKDKITICKSDAIEYLNSCDINSFDHVNVDIWYDVYDMIFPYLRSLEVEFNNPNVKFSYWLEGSLKESIQRSILAAICNYPTPGFLIDKIASDIVRDTEIKSYEDVYNLVDIHNLRELLYKWYCDNIDVVNEYEKINMEKVKQSHQVTKKLINGDYIRNKI